MDKLNLIIWVKGNLMFSGDIVSETEKAFKAKITSYVAYPGVNDNIGRELGFLWIPKSACILDERGVYNVKKWFVNAPKRFLKK